ncbi:MAG TPA: capsular biosynthesis protein [Candidatus Binatia bacterium]|nr:capsular biosynthesis protein [Candidatus Binatia bacterium]
MSATAASAQAMVAGGTHRSVFARMFGSAVVSQAVLSAASLLVGLLLIRRTSDAQYGSYVLVFNAMMLLNSLQNAFFNPVMVIRMARADRAGKADVVGGLYREQLRMLRPLVWVAAFVTVVLRLTGHVDNATALLLLAGIAAARAALNREYFRISLLAHRRSSDVLRGDLFYVFLLIGGAALATLTPLPAAVTLLGMSLAAIAAGGWMARRLTREEGFNPQGLPGLLREVAPTAMWTTAGAGIHWLFSQGYSYIVAVQLDVAAVAAVAACRLLLMPVNLVSTGVSSLMLPITTGWLRECTPRQVFARLCLFTGVLCAGALCYVGVMWLMRDWIFATILKKDFAQRDVLLGLWSLTAILMILRDQLLYLLLARERFRRLTGLAAASALLSLVTTYWGMLLYGVAGALLGVIAGELLSVAGIVVMSRREMRLAEAA